MSVIRRSDPDSRGVYIYEYAEGKWDCQDCPMSQASGSLILAGWLRTAWHIVQHWRRGEIVTLWPVISRIGRA